MKRALKGFGNVLGNCLANKHYLLWAKKHPVSTPPAPQKSETVLKVSDDVHRARYNAMSTKATAARSASAPPPSAPPPSAPVAPGILASTTKPTGLSVEKSPGLPHGKEANISVIKNDMSNESDPAKLERKRRQQQKKDEFLQQAKHRKMDEIIPGTGSGVKSEKPSSSPKPEGLLCLQFSMPQSLMVCIYIMDFIKPFHFKDDTETWMRELNADSFRLVNDADWGNEGAKISNQGKTANATNASSAAKSVFNPPSAAAPTIQKPANIRKRD